MALRARNILSLCAGVGGLELGILLALGYRGETGRGICYVEREAAAAASLVASMEAGWLHPAPVWSDMLTFDARPWRGLVHILASGDPCQDNSVAGKRAGADGERFLAPEVCRLAAECRPDIIFRENVPGNADGQLHAIVPPLERLGYRVAAGIFSSAETGNTMRRERLFIMAVAGDERRQQDTGSASGDEGAHEGRPALSDHQPSSASADMGSSIALAECQDEPGRMGAGPEREYLSDAGGCGEPVGSPIGCRDGRLATVEGRGSIERAAAERTGGGGQRELVQPEGVGPGKGGTEHAREQGRCAAAGAGREMGSASGPESQGQQRGQHLPSGWQVKGGHPLLSGGAVLPPAIIPGPSDSRWIDVLDRFPELQPALSEEEAQSHLRRGIDALAHRVERLRATGNGVDPITAAYAYLCLERTLRECHR